MPHGVRVDRSVQRVPRSIRARDRGRTLAGTRHGGPWSAMVWWPALERKLGLEGFGSRRKSAIRAGIRTSSTNSKPGVFRQLRGESGAGFGGRVVANKAVVERLGLRRRCLRAAGLDPELYEG